NPSDGWRPPRAMKMARVPRERPMRLFYGQSAGRKRETLEGRPSRAATKGLERAAPRLCAGAGADHEAVEAVFRHLPPQVLIAAEGHDRVIDLLEVGVAGRELGVDFVRRLERRIHHRRRERAQLRAAGDQPL